MEAIPSDFMIWTTTKSTSEAERYRIAFAGGILGLIAVITGVQLGLDKFSVTLPNGVSITAEDARGRALEGLEKAGEALEPEEP